MNTTVAACRCVFRPRPEPWPGGLNPIQVWVLLGALVLLAAMMVFYVQLLFEQVARGERLRQAQRAQGVVMTAAATPSPRAAAPLEVSTVSQR